MKAATCKRIKSLIPYAKIILVVTTYFGFFGTFLSMGAL
jgi:hypothetical protein